MGSSASGLDAEIREELLTCVSTNTRMASRALTRHYDEILSPSGLRVTQLSILAAVAYHGPFTMKVLAQALVMDRSTLTSDLRPLEAQGWVTITVGQDRRSRVITITPGGKKRIEAALPLWRQAQQQIELVLGQGRLQTLLTELQEVTALTRLP